MDRRMDGKPNVTFFTLFDKVAGHAAELANTLVKKKNEKKEWVRS